MTDYMHHLFSYVPSERLDTFSYGHVIPAENLAAQSLVKGVMGSEFDFTYEARESEKMVTRSPPYNPVLRELTTCQINDLGRTISMLCQVIPDGVVAFFPSYDYLDRVLNTWKKPISNDNPQITILSLIEKKKPVLYETRESTTGTEELLQEYTKIIKDKDTSTSRGTSKGGALLLSVVGGKLSEGINFSDSLGRAVIMIGLPFPNIRSAVWQAKIQHVEQKTLSRLSSEPGAGSEESQKSAAKAAGRDFYENACMRAVNQCIGRAIRHQNDYAAIILLDRRYELPRIQNKLPAWIRQSMVAGGGQRSAAVTAQELAKFFAKRGRGT